MILKFITKTICSICASQGVPSRQKLNDSFIYSFQCIKDDHIYPEKQKAFRLFSEIGCWICYTEDHTSFFRMDCSKCTLIKLEVLFY